LTIQKQTFITYRLVKDNKTVLEQRKKKCTIKAITIKIAFLKLSN